MKIAVMGAGAVGCYYGALLARAGHEVVLIGRAALVEAVQRHGLLLETAEGCTAVAVAASDDVAACQDADWCLFCVKSIDTESAGAAMRPYLRADCEVFAMQNGVDNAARLSAVLQHPVHEVAVYVATAMAGPGHVRHFGRGDLVLPPLPFDILDTWQAAGVSVTPSTQVQGALWDKLIVNCAFNALSALSGLPYGPLMAFEGVRAVMAQVIDECVAVAQALQVPLQTDPREAVERIARSMPGQHSSTAQDLMRGKPTEIEHLNGAVVRHGQALGVATPANLTLLTLVRLRSAAQAGTLTG